MDGDLSPFDDRWHSLNVASQVSGILGVANGGTGWANINSGYIPFGNGASALSTSTNLFWDNTNSRLGVGTTSPAYKLDVSGTIGTGAAGTDGKVGFKRTSDGVELAGVGVDGGNSWLYLNSGASNGTVFQMSGTEVARITNAGNVGIGTTSPDAVLTVGNSGANNTLVGHFDFSGNAGS